MRFRKKPVVIEAMQFGPQGMAAAIIAWAHRYGVTIQLKHSGLCIHTLEGPMLASRGDWVIRGIHNEFYACKPDIFEKTYEVAE